MAKIQKRTWLGRGPTGHKVRKVAWGYTLQVGRKQERKFSADWTRDDAQNELAKRLLERDAPAPPAVPKTLGQVAQEYLDYKRGKEKRSIRQDEQILAKLKARLSADTPITEVTAQRIAQYERDRVVEDSKPEHTRVLLDLLALPDPARALELCHECWATLQPDMTRRLPGLELIQSSILASRVHAGRVERNSVKRQPVLSPSARIIWPRALRAVCRPRRQGFATPATPSAHPASCGRRSRRSCRVRLAGAPFEWSKCLCRFMPQPFLGLSAKVRLTEPLKEGTKGRLYFLPPHWRPRAVEAIVWRMDLDGVVLQFTGPSIASPPAAGDVRRPGSWLWTWKACAPSPWGDRQKAVTIEPGPGGPRR